MTVLYLAITLGFIAYLTVETIILNKAINKIPLRILINGTRGKSSFVQILCKAMNNSGVKTIGKITGEIPLTIKPDGSTILIKRFSPASIKENIAWLKQASKQKPDAVVLECMALQPETQAILGRRIFKPQYTIITNIFYDHAEVMGQTLNEMVKTISLCIAKNSQVIGDDDTFDLFQNAGVSITNFSIANKESVSRSDKDIINHPVSIMEQQQNLLYTLGYKFNIERKIINSAINEYWKCKDRATFISIPQNNITFYDLFSVNDSGSTKHLLDHIIENIKEDSTIIILFNTREDRPLRTQDISNLLNNYNKVKEIWITGPGKLLARHILNNKFNLHVLSRNEVLGRLSEGFDLPVTIIGIGNHRGTEKILNSIRQLKNGNKKEPV